MCPSFGRPTAAPGALASVLMLSRKIPLDDPTAPPPTLAPTYASRGLSEPVPRNSLPHASMDPQVAYQLIHDELALDANPALNLATFVTTYMDSSADRLMAETMNKNAIDWDEYPQTVVLQDRCVNMLSRLFSAPEAATGVGTATVGSSEAIHLAGLALKFRWRARRAALGADPTEMPNLVMGANVQVCWEKFCRYFDVEPRYVPLTPSASSSASMRPWPWSTSTPSAWSASWARPTPASTSPWPRSTPR